MTVRVCAITSTRADYGLLRGVLAEIQATPQLELRILVTGTHLDVKHGYTLQEIKADGWEPDALVDLEFSGDDGLSTAAAAGLAISRGAAALSELDPDIVLVLGDRFEIFAFAAASTVLRLPIAHIAGGDTTEGAFDEAFRHSITKMSHLHFVTNEEARARVMQMGEDPRHVWNAGSPGVDAILRTPLWPAETVAKLLGWELRPRNLVITFHPPTLDKTPATTQLEELLIALDRLGPETGLIFTRPNADPSGGELADIVESFVANRPHAILRDSLGARLYYSVVALSDAVVGNSSSGLIEAPALGSPTVDIGSRQAGRLAGPSVVHSPASHREILAAIHSAFGIDRDKIQSPYGGGRTAKTIAEVLASLVDPRTLLDKKFHWTAQSGCKRASEQI